MPGQAAGLHPGNDLIFAVRAVHAGGITQGEEAFVARRHARRGFEIDRAAFVAGDGAFGNAGGGLAGGEESGKAEDGGEEQCFHRMLVFVLFVFG